MTSISKNVYIDKLDKKVNKYNSTYHKTINTNVKSKTYINSSKEINDKDPIFKIVDIVRISKYKNVFSKYYVQNCSEEVSMIKRIKNTVQCTYVISELNGEEIVGTFYEKVLQKTKQKRI